MSPDLQGQVSINTSGNAPDPSAMLDIKSNSKGVLVPRMSESQRNAITDPALGLLVFDTISTHFFFYNGVEWEKINRTDTLSVIADADGDTKIQVEESADEDLIRFDLGGTEKWLMTGSRLEPMNSGNSVYIGFNAGLNDDHTDNNCVGIGWHTLYNNTSGGGNVGVGDFAGAQNTTGKYNVFVGEQAGAYKSTGDHNVFIGRLAGGGNTNNYNCSKNTAIGSQAGNNMNGNGNVFLGFNAGFYQTGSNKLYIENSNADSTHALIYGEFDNDLLAINGTLRVNDGTQSEGFVLTSDADGNAHWGGLTEVFDVADGVVFSGTAVDMTSDDFVFGSPQLDDDDYNPHDSRFFFDKGKYAFRAGKVLDDEWNSNNVGGGSFATGYQTIASGANTIAMGVLATASREYAVSIGVNVTASGYSATAFGNRIEAPSGYEFALGRYNTTYNPGSNTGWDEEDRIFTIGNGTSSSDRSDAMVVLKNGKVGFGESRPFDLLEMRSDSAGKGITVANPRPVLTLEDTDANTWLIQMNATDLQFTEEGVGTAMTIESSTGDVGIGVSNPGVALQVGTNGDGTIARANTWAEFSDRRWKKNLYVIPNALDKLGEVHGYYYNWKESSDTSQQVGVIAQEIQTILPQCVNTDDEGYLSVDYGKLTAWLIQVNKEQQEQIDALKVELNNSDTAQFRAEVDALKEQIAAILQVQENVTALSKN